MPDTRNGRAGRADVVIVGGGSAGGVLASRLSEEIAERIAKAIYAAQPRVALTAEES